MRPEDNQRLHVRRAGRRIPSRGTRPDRRPSPSASQLDVPERLVAATVRRVILLAQFEGIVGRPSDSEPVEEGDPIARVVHSPGPGKM
jgi:hypothetical protein